MEARNYIRLRDALLDIFASIVLEHCCKLIRKQELTAGNSQFRGRLKRQTLLSGDIIAINHTRVIVVDVGRQDGATSILRCWHDMMNIQPNLRPHVTLFYVSVVKTPRNTSNSPTLWTFVQERAKSDLGPGFEAYYGECVRPQLNPHENIPAAILQACQVQLREQGLWQKLVSFLSEDQSRIMGQFSWSPLRSESVGKIYSRT